MGEADPAACPRAPDNASRGPGPRAPPTPFSLRPPRSSRRGCSTSWGVRSLWPLLSSPPVHCPGCRVVRTLPRQARTGLIRGASAIGRAAGRRRKGGLPGPAPAPLPSPTEARGVKRAPTSSFAGGRLERKARSRPSSRLFQGTTVSRDSPYCHNHV